jgi:phosphotransferase system HPr (HPr) family protein
MQGSSEGGNAPYASELACDAAITLTGDLHARPAGLFVIAAAKFSSSIQITVGTNTVDAKSVLSVMSLGATCGQQVLVRATGSDARQAVDTLIGILAQATPVGG